MGKLLEETADEIRFKPVMWPLEARSWTVGASPVACTIGLDLDGQEFIQLSAHVSPDTDFRETAL